MHSQGHRRDQARGRERLRSHPFPVTPWQDDCSLSDAGCTAGAAAALVGRAEPIVSRERDSGSLFGRGGSKWS